MLSKIFNFIKKKDNDDEQTELKESHLGSDWSFLQTDIHSHFIPGIDDGAQTIEDSIMLIREMHAMGFRNIITTPHIKFDHYPNTTATILQGLHGLQQALKENNIDMPIKAAAEYFVDDHFMQLLENEPLLTIRNKEILIEFSFVFEPMGLFDTIFKIQTYGYRPILAHPERYSFFHNKPNIYSELKDRGCLFQLNTISLSGYYGRIVKDIADSMIGKNLYDYCGSDMHHIRHAEVLKKLMLSNSFNTLRDYPFLNAQLLSN
ncbi:MAG: CpsB/CapC family capsule biosynthesis tyrosine phosphatase [Bacteroidota bacterium]